MGRQRARCRHWLPDARRVARDVGRGCRTVLKQIHNEGDFKVRVLPEDVVWIAYLGCRGIKSGNEQFAKDITAWTFQEKLVLRIDSTTHHLLNETEPREHYTIKGQISSSTRHHIFPILQINDAFTCLKPSGPRGIRVPIQRKCIRMGALLRPHRHTARVHDA